MAAESVTLVLAVFCVCVCVCVCHSLRFFSARDRCPPANLLNLFAMYAIRTFCTPTILSLVYPAVH
jgi:hypothetical protein